MGLICEVKSKARSAFEYEIERGRGLIEGAAPINVWNWEQWRYGELMKTWSHGNLTTTEGRTHMLDVTFDGTTAKEGTWYIAIFESASTPVVTWVYDSLFDGAAGAVLGGVTECTAYDEAARVAYNEAAAASASMTNAAGKATFTMNATKTVYGACLVSLNTKSDHTAGDYVYSAGTFGTAASVESGDVLKITLVLSLSDV